MKHHQLLLGSIARIAAVVCLAWGSVSGAPPAYAAPGCDAGDLDGTFSYVVHGTNPLGQPFGAIGTFTSDGAGNIEGLRIAVDDGVYGTAEFTCTYSMSPQCAFRGPCIDDGEALAEIQLDGALAEGGKEIMLLLSRIPDIAGGPVVTGVARRQ